MEHDRNRKRKAKDSEVTVDQSTEVEKKKKKSKKKAKVEEHDGIISAASAASRVGNPTQQVSNSALISEQETGLDYVESHDLVGKQGQSLSHSQCSGVVDYELDHNETKTKKKLKKVKEEQVDFDKNESANMQEEKKVKKSKKKKKRIKEEEHANYDTEGDEECVNADSDEEKHIDIAERKIQSKKARENIAEHNEVEQVSSYEASRGEENEKKKKKNKKNRHAGEEEVTNQCEGVSLREECDNVENESKKTKKKKKKKKKKEEENVDLEEDDLPGVMSEKKRPKSDQYEGKDPKKKKKKEKEKTEENVKSAAECERGESSMHMSPPAAENNNGNMSAKKKKVSFQDQVMEERKNIQEEISASENENGDDIDDLDNQEKYGEQVWGHRFTRKENATLRRAVFDYIRRKGWEEEEGLEKVLNCKKYREARDCWSEINACLPHRPRQAIRFRAHMMLDPGSHLGRWSKQEEETLRSLYEKHGRKWKEFVDVIGRSRACIKEKWRTLKRKKGTGVWTQDELQHLSDMVHKCYRVKALLGPRISNDRHLLRDDLNWEKIADDIETHGHGACASKWYYHLTSSMVQEGIWANEDDYLLLKGLLESGACGEEEVDWESVLEHRSGQVSIQRWKQMCKYLGENRTKAFLDKLDILVERYAPEILEKTTDKPDNATVNDA